MPTLPFTCLDKCLDLGSTWRLAGESRGLVWVSAGFGCRSAMAATGTRFLPLTSWDLLESLAGTTSWLPLTRRRGVSIEACSTAVIP